MLIVGKYRTPIDTTCRLERGLRFAAKTCTLYSVAYMTPINITAGYGKPRLAIKHVFINIFRGGIYREPC